MGEAKRKVENRFLEDAAELVARELEQGISAEAIAAINARYECFGGNVVVHRIREKEETTEAGVIKRTSRSQEAIVVLVGPGEYLADGNFVPTSLLPGDRVLVTRNGGTDIELGDAKLLLLHIKQVYLGEKRRLEHPITIVDEMAGQSVTFK